MITTTSPQTDRMLQFFAYTHLPPQLQPVAQPFFELAQHVISALPRNPERTVCLRSLLEARDGALRTWVDQG